MVLLHVYVNIVLQGILPSQTGILTSFVLEFRVIAPCENKELEQAQCGCSQLNLSGPYENDFPNYRRIDLCYRPSRVDRPTGFREDDAEKAREEWPSCRKANVMDLPVTFSVGAAVKSRGTSVRMSAVPAMKNLLQVTPPFILNHFLDLIFHPAAFRAGTCTRFIYCHSFQAFFSRALLVKLNTMRSMVLDIETPISCTARSMQETQMLPLHTSMTDSKSCLMQNRLNLMSLFRGACGATNSPNDFVRVVCVLLMNYTSTSTHSPPVFRLSH